MRQLKIDTKDAGQRLDKFLAKYMALASKSFLYKMLRKKNIVLNGKRAEGGEKLCPGDEVKLFLSEETIENFRKEANVLQVPIQFQVIYEDSNILIINKPVGVLSQGAKKGDVSLVEMLASYLHSTGALSEEDLRSFSPAVCNRLDRNTSGLVVAGKSLAGLQKMTELFRDHTIQKYYFTIVSGEQKKELMIDGYLYKDKEKNRSEILTEQEYIRLPMQKQENYTAIRTKYRPVCCKHGFTLLEVQLFTGKPHQIRAHLAALGTPVAGDPKYGNLSVNRKLFQEYGLCAQLLHAYRLVFPKLTKEFEPLSEKEICCEPPEVFQRVQKGLKL